MQFRPSYHSEFTLCVTGFLTLLCLIIFTDKCLHSQKYSLYLPVYEKFHAKNSHRKPSTSRDTDTRVAKEQEKQARADALAKRRSTMNSRSAYDEEEVLRAVLEQSKKEGAVLAPDNGTRKTKRGRDESEE